MERRRRREGGTRIKEIRRREGKAMAQIFFGHECSCGARQGSGFRAQGKVGLVINKSLRGLSSLRV